MSIADLWGAPVEGAPASVEAWNHAWTTAMHFTGDPFASLATANAADPSFSLGSVFCGTYRVLGGTPFDDRAVRDDLERAHTRARSAHDVAHCEALRSLQAGEFTAAAARWDAIAAEQRDFAAVRFAHDVYLHVGDNDGRLRSSRAASARFDSGAGASWVAGQLAFALVETGSFGDVERLALHALAEDPLDLWALHALAHLYEETDASQAAFELLASRASTWQHQDALAVHIHWHRALRLIADRRLDEALALHDELVPVATTAFRLCDLASILWRIELAADACGETIDRPAIRQRWRHVADAFAARPERHTCGFLDLHMALAFTRRAHHPTAEPFFVGVESSHADDPSENGATFREVVAPLTRSIRLSHDDPAEAARCLDAIAPELHRIGGSNAQRAVIALTRTSLPVPPGVSP